MSVEEDGPSTSGSLSSLIAGPVAGVCSRFIFYPGDTIKSRLQVQGGLSGPQPYSGTLDAIIQVARKEGFRGFYKGFPAVALGNVPANMAYFGGYELGKKLVPASWGVVGDMAAGAVAQLLGGLIFTPIDIVKERMQVQSIMAGRFNYSGSWHAMKSLVADAGVAGLFRGYWATNAVWIPWSIIHISIYEQAKRSAAATLASMGMLGQPQAQQASSSSSAPASSTSSQHSSSSQTDSSQFDTQQGAASGSGTDQGPTPPNTDLLPAWAVGACSCFSASVASILTHPADVIKTRLQVMSSGAQRLTSLDVAREALRREGPKVFASGALVRVLTLAPGSAVSWAIYEPVKRALGG